MARRSAWCFIFVLFSLFLNPALARGRQKKQQPNGQPITLTPPPPPPPTTVLSPPTSNDKSSLSPPLPPRVKGHHGKKKNHGLVSPPTSAGMSSPSSPPLPPSNNETLGLSSPPITAPPRPETGVAPPAAPEVPGSIALIVKSTNFTDHICDLAANTKQCEKILEGKDKKYIDSLPAGTSSLLSLELSAGIASNAVLDMSNKMTNNNIDSSATTCVENYQDAIVGFTGAYANFTLDPTTATQSLNVADVKLGLCEISLSSGEPRCFLPQIDETNKLLRSLIQLVLKEFPQ